MCLPSSVLIAQAVFLSERGHTDRRNGSPYTHGLAAVGVGDDSIFKRANVPPPKLCR